MRPYHRVLVINLKFKILTRTYMPSNVNETNPAVLHAELSFYANSHREDYEKDVYSGLKKIELTCATDYATVCRAFTKDALFDDTITRKTLDYHKSSGQSSRPDDNHGRINHQDNISPGPHDHFIASLGYGDAGDICMYLNYAKLSNNCQLVVADFRDLKEKYRKEEQHSPTYGPLNVKYPSFALVAFAILWFPFIYIERKRLKTKEMRAMVTGIEADPALDAQRKSCVCNCLHQNTVP